MSEPLPLEQDGAVTGFAWFKGCSPLRRQPEDVPGDVWVRLPLPLLSADGWWKVARTRQEAFDALAAAQVQLKREFPDG